MTGALVSIFKQKDISELTGGAVKTRSCIFWRLLRLNRAQPNLFPFVRPSGPASFS